jgi:hypothetical protein
MLAATWEAGTFVSAKHVAVAKTSTKVNRWNLPLRIVTLLQL